MATTSIDDLDFQSLRQRNKPQKVDPSYASDLVGRLNEEEKAKGKDRKTFGRTDDGTVFVVPESHDMVSQLLSPSQPKNLGDLVILAILAFHIALFYYTPTTSRSWILGLTFFVWRISYDIGIGYLLDVQSKYNRLVTWAKKTKVFENPSKGRNRYPGLYHFIKSELETKIVKDYALEEAPVEYNTWLVFRRVVDLVLMSDFVSYCLLAISLGSGERPIQESIWMTAFRWAGGIALILFNIWVKLDAHRVVKDYAWYWGDFFFLVVEEPIFDGVFQMAPHPMYSIGYVGYYGIAALAKSYPLLFISIAAHLLQFAFLFVVEMPHMVKTYPDELEPREQQLPSISHQSIATTSNRESPLTLTDRPSSIHNLTGIGNLDLCRLADVLGILIPIYSTLAVLVTPSDNFTQILFVLHAMLWRFWYAAGLGFILHCESVKKLWTRHFLKYGESNDEAWRKWKEAYYVSERMALSTFVAAAVKIYKVPDDFLAEYALLKHVIAVALIGLQLLISTSTYDVLGEFGWFYGDFFFRKDVRLNYKKGPYRYLNNPEQFAGIAGLWGAVLLTESRMIFALTLLTHFLAFVFYHAVERPHQRRIYRDKIRKDAGVMLALKPMLPTFLEQWDMDAALDHIVDRIELVMDSVIPKLMRKLNAVSERSTALLHRIPTRTSKSSVNKIDLKDYRIEILLPHSTLAKSMVNYGDPIKLRWSAPRSHHPRDWIGVYSVSQVKSLTTTNVSSSGRWIPTTKGQYETSIADVGCISSDKPISDNNGSMVYGEMEFRADKLWWETGTYEFRYHHNGGHDVLAISTPFEIQINHFDSTDDDSMTTPITEHNEVYLQAVEQALLPVLQNCFDRDPSIAPGTVTDAFGRKLTDSKSGGKFAKRAVYAIRHMFGLDFDPEIVKLDGTVRNLAWRISMAKRILAPHPVSSPHGTRTPDQSL